MIKGGNYESGAVVNTDDSVGSQYSERTSFGKNVLCYFVGIGILTAGIAGVYYVTQDRNQEKSQIESAEMQKRANRANGRVEIAGMEERANHAKSLENIE